MFSLRLLSLVACALTLGLGFVGSSVAIPPNGREPIPERPTTPQPPRPPQPVPANSLPVTLQLNQFICHNADEDSFYSNGDEPYLFVAAIYADGTTIQLSNLANARVRIQSPSKTHGNLGRKNVKAGNRFAIPTATGSFSTRILPIGGLPETIAKQKSMVGIIVIAMEEDTTPTSAANAGRQALVNVLQKDLDQAIRTVSSPDVNVLKNRIASAMRQAIKQESLRSISGIFSVVDPDDYIGADFAMWSYQEIQNAGGAGLPINMNFKKSGVHYQVTGLVKTP
jgi:hypothetical protein